MKTKVSLLIFILFSLSVFNIKAINISDSLQSRLKVFNQEKPLINLYVHLDRNSYMPEDTIWFKAYVLTPYLNDVLFVRITDRKKNIVLEKQFLMYDIRAHGDIYLPDTLSEGKYYFYAYTDKMISLNPNDIFVQPITINKTITKRLEVSASVTNIKKVHRGDKVEILTRVRNIEGKTYKGNYSLWIGENLLKKGNLATNSLGEAYIRFNYPDIYDTEMVRCEIRFKQDKDFAELILNLRHEGNTAHVKAFAEGGHFLEGVNNHAILEVFDDGNNPMEVKVDLLQNKKVIAETLTNKFGMGSIYFIPRKGFTYSLAVHENDTTRIFPFPADIESDGYGLQIKSLNGKKTAIIKNLSKSDTANIILRTLDKIVWNRTHSIKYGDSLIIELPDSLTKSVLNLAVFDSLSKPVAQRLYLNTLEEPYKVYISTSRTSVNSQTAIKINLSALDLNNKPIAANLSVSIVEKSTLNKSTYRTITQAYHFKNIFGSNLNYNEFESGFDNRLITTTWGIKDWSYILRYKPSGYIRMLNNAGGINGKLISKYGNPIKIERLMIESVTIFDTKDYADMITNIKKFTAQPGSAKSGRNLITVKDWAELLPLDSSGGFKISPKSLLVSGSQTKVLKPETPLSLEYDIVVTDYSMEMDEFVRNSDVLNFIHPVNTFTKYEAPSIKMLNKVIQLKEVTIEEKGRFLLSNNNLGKKEDYICKEYNVFNCRNHRSGGYKPRAGMIYLNNEKGTLFLYNGVGKEFSPAPPGSVAGSINYFPIRNISKPSVFYNPESSDSTFLKSESRSTIFWSPNVYLDESGKTSFNCNLSDRSGEFIITVQGIEVKSRKPVYGTYEFKL